MPAGVAGRRTWWTAVTIFRIRLVFGMFVALFGLSVLVDLFAEGATAFASASQVWGDLNRSFRSRN